MRNQLHQICSILLLALIAAIPAGAQTQQEADNMAAIFCEAMQDPALYEQNHFEAYKMLIAGNDGWIFRAASDMRTDFSLEKKTLRDLAEINAVFKGRGSTLVILFTPTRAMMHYDYIQKTDRRKYGITDIDAAWKSYRKMLGKLDDLGIHATGIERPEDFSAPFFYKRDHHWNPEGARKAAQQVAGYVKQLPAYQKVAKLDYRTEALGGKKIYGVSKKVFKKLCGSRQPPELITHYQTTRTDLAHDKAALFGDVKNPDIALLGTSNSTMLPSYANFEGFLKEALSADVLNMSVSGGGLDASMLSFLASSFYTDTPPKIVIWEIPGNYDLNNETDFFREAIAAAYGTCDAAVANITSHTISRSNPLLLGNLKNKAVKGDAYYLTLNFAKPVLRPFKIDLRYHRDRDRYRFDHSGRAPGDSNFFLALKPDGSERLEKIFLYPPAELLGQKVDARICKKDPSVFLASATEQTSGSGVIGLLRIFTNTIRNFAGFLQGTDNG